MYIKYMTSSSFGLDALIAKEALLRLSHGKMQEEFRLFRIETPFPAGIELVELADGFALVVHQPIDGRRGHLLTTDLHSPTEILVRSIDEFCSSADLPVPGVKLKMTAQFTWRDRILRTDGMLVLPVLDGVIKPAITDIRRRRIAPSSPVAIKALSPAIEPAVVKAIIWARVSDQEQTRSTSHEHIARQVVSILRSPPPGIESDWSNVGVLKVVLEHCSSFRHPLCTRKALQFIRSELEIGTIISVTNIDRATRRADEVDDLLSELQEKEAKLYAMYLKPQSNATAGEEGLADRTWSDLSASSARAKEHLENSMQQVQEAAFYTDSALAIDRALLSLGASGKDYRMPRVEVVERINAFKKSIEIVCRNNLLSSIVLLTRTSKDHSENSLERQKIWLETLCPAVDDIRLIHVELNGHSAATQCVTGRILEELEVRDSLVLFTSIERLVRRPEHLDELGELAKKRNLSFAGTVWPADEFPILIQAASNEDTTR
ncbi:hypothetical protein OIV83_006508, partial [Microbotryomycetes sp. JL201]